MLLRPYWIGADTPAHAFPDPDRALDEPNGLLAAGGDLSPERLLHAYRLGVFPWYSAGQPILWWSPDPRAVLFPERMRVSRSLRKTLRQGRFRVTRDTAFREVMDACAAPRPGSDGTWITPEMLAAYTRLHSLGWAHSVECWRDGRLAGGLYGVAMGRVFFGESMFSRESDASKVALAHLAGQGYRLIDCQVESEHLARLGAEPIPRRTFRALLDELTEPEPAPVPAAEARP